jgi:hypothetical protein
VASFCEHGNEPSGFVKFEQFGMSLFVCLFVGMLLSILIVRAFLITCISNTMQPSFLRLFDGNLREHRGVFTRPR